MDSKQRARLKSQAHDLDAIIQIGKNGVTTDTIKVVKDALNNKELIKIKVIEGCPIDKKEVAVLLADNTSSQVVQVIGSKIVLYKKNILKKKKIKHVKLSESKSEQKNHKKSFTNDVFQKHNRNFKNKKKFQKLKITNKCLI